MAGKQVKARVSWNLLLFFLFGPALFATTIPFFYSVPYGGEGVLLFIVIALFSFAFVVTLRTFVIATDSITRDLEPTRWTLLTLTGISTRQIVLPRWRNVIRQVCSWHILSAMLRVGFALALVQYIQDGGFRILQPLCQTDSSVLQSGLCSNFQVVYLGNFDPHMPPVRPVTLKTVYTLSLLLMLGVAESGMTAAIGLLTALVGSRIRIAVALLLRLLIILLCTSLYMGAAIYIYAALSRTDYTRYVENLNNADTAAVLRQIILGLTSLIDGGVSIGALIMHPNIPGIFHVFVHGIGALIASGSMLLIALVCLHILQLGLARRGADYTCFSPRERISVAWGYLLNWFHPAIYNSEQKFLRRRNINWRTWSGVSAAAGIVIVLVIAWIPRWVFFHHLMGDWLLLIAIVSMSAIFAISFRTTMTAADAISREWRSASWEVLRLTPIEVRQFIVTKWLAVTRWALPIHLLTVPLRIGLAYGVAQYLHATYLFPKSLFRAFTFISWNGSITTTSCTNYGYGSSVLNQTFPVCYPAHFPDLSRILTSGMMLLVISLAEVGFLTALGFVCAAVSRGNVTKRIVIAVSLRFVVVIFAIGIALLFGSLLQPVSFPPDNPLNLSKAWIDNIRFDQQVFSRVIETQQIALSTLIDGGVMAATNFMRPLDYMFRIYFVLRQFLCVLLGAALFIGLTAICLSMTIRIVGRPLHIIPLRFRSAAK